MPTLTAEISTPNSRSIAKEISIARAPLAARTRCLAAGNPQGIVFELSPPSSCPSGDWCETVLYNFCSIAACADGLIPTYAYVTFDNLGNLYGTTQQGGSNGYGTVFELSPEPLSGCPPGSNPGTGWCETVLYSFCSVAGCTDGEYPSNGLVWDPSGNLYGTTQGSANAGGTVYELSPNGRGGWTEKVIYPVSMGNAGLAIDASGNLYGVDASNDVFKLSLAKGVWTATNLHTFTGGSDGLNPEGSPAVDTQGMCTARHCTAGAEATMERCGS